MTKTHVVPAKIAIVLGASWIISGSLCVFTGLRKLKGRGGVRLATITFGASLAYLGTAAIDGGIYILKEEGVLN